MTHGAEAPRFKENPKDVEQSYYVKHLLGTEFPRFSPVVSAAIIDASTLLEDGSIGMSTKIFTGVRDPIENLTDPNVISVPTKRIAPARLQRVLAPYALTDIEDVSTRSAEKVIFRWGAPEAGAQNENHAQDFVQELFEEKLGVKDALADGSLQIVKVEPKVSVFGKVYGTNEDPENGEEMIHMAAMRVLVDFGGGESPFPKKTESYYSTQFLRVDDYIQLVDQKDPFVIMQYGDFAEICVRGLCVLSANEMIKGEQRKLS